MSQSLLKESPIGDPDLQKSFISGGCLKNASDGCTYVMRVG